MVMFLSMVNWLARMMVKSPLKVIVPPEHRPAMAWRSDPAPLSALLVTVTVVEHVDVVSVAELFPGVGSVTPAGVDTVAVFVRLPVAETEIAALAV
jgi:hypothetical protein